MISIPDILNSISDDKGLVLFNTIALANGETEIQIRKWDLLQSNTIQGYQN